MLVATAIVSLALLNALAAESAAAPAMSDIVANVTKATTPDKDFQVEVTQTITKENAAAAEKPIKSTYTVSWTPAGGFSAAKPAAAEGEKAAPSVQVQVDLLRSLKELAKWKDVAVAAEQVDGHPGVRITAKGQAGDMSCEIWVDTERWIVTRIRVAAGEKTVMDGSFEHRRVNDAYWLLSKSNLKQETDGARITQEYGAYSIENK